MHIVDLSILMVFKHVPELQLEFLATCLSALNVNIWTPPKLRHHSGGYLAMPEPSLCLIYKTSRHFVTQCLNKTCMIVVNCKAKPLCCAA